MPKINWQEDLGMDGQDYLPYINGMRGCGLNCTLWTELCGMNRTVLCGLNCTVWTELYGVD